MKAFKDKHQREWQLVVDIGQIKVVRDLVKVDIYKLFADEAKRLFSDPCLLVDTLYALCRQQCQTRNMSDVDFGQSFDGDILERAADALMEEVVSFFPTSRREILRATIAKSRELAEPIQMKMLEQISAITLTDLLKPTASLAS